MFEVQVIVLPKYHAGQTVDSYAIVQDISTEMKARRKLELSEEQYRLLFEESKDAILHSDPESHTILAANQAAQRMFGLDEQALCACSIDEIVDMTDPVTMAGLREREERGEARAEIPLRRGDGSWFTGEVTSRLFNDSSGGRLATTIIRDVTEKRDSEERMRLADAAFKTASEAILICDEGFYVLDCNDAYLHMTGLEQQVAIEGKPWFLDIGEQARAIGKALKAEGHWQGQLLQQRVDGSIFVSRGKINVIEQPGNRPQRITVIFSDISELQKAERQIDYLSYQDPLTDLPNRTALLNMFEHLNLDNRPENRLAFIHINLDRTKAINESLGHAIVDDILCETGERLKALCERGDFIARVGGDEFSIVKIGIDTEQQALQFARHALDKINQSLESGPSQLQITGSAGISIYPDYGETLEKLLRQADVAMRRAKQAGRGNVVAFDPTMHETVVRRFTVEHELHTALERNELFVEYQPILRISDGAILGAEALLRWKSPDLGRVEPIEFIRAAEQTGLITEIGRWVMEETCHKVTSWRKLSPDFRTISVNVSPAQFLHEDFVAGIRAVIKRNRISGDAIRLEITENFAMLDPDWSINLLNQLRGLGFTLALDDFGTGYSSLTYLQQLPVDYMKLDKSFIQRLTVSQKDARIMESVVQLAHELDLRVVAEGVETREQHGILRGWKCDEAQGFLYAHPMAADKLEAMLREKSPRANG